MTTLQKTICASLVLLGMAGASPLWADDRARDLAIEINTANGLLRDGDVDGAIAAYRQLQDSGPPSSDLSYNLAVAQYRKGDLSAAADQFRSVAAEDNDAIAAKARFNLGNCDYVSALQLAEKDRPAAIERLQSAIGNYRAALDVDPTDADARANIELAAQLIDKLHQLDKQEQQQQQNQQQQEQQQDQQQQSSDQQDQQQSQQNQQQSGQSGQEQQQQDQPSQSQSDQGNEDRQDKSSSEQSQQESGQSENERSSQEESESEQRNQQDGHEAGQHDNGAEESPTQRSRSQQNPTRTRGDQNPGREAEADNGEEGKAAPEGVLSAAQPSDQDDRGERRGLVADERSMDGEITEEEAAKMLQAIRDREMIRRLRRQAAERNKHIPVDRDW